MGMGWTVVTAAVKFALAAGKARTGAALDTPVLKTEGRVTLIEGLLAAGPQQHAGLVVGRSRSRLCAGLLRRARSGRSFPANTNPLAAPGGDDEGQPGGASTSCTFGASHRSAPGAAIRSQSTSACRMRRKGVKV
ncbi:hypothetical protein GCM10009665_06710 [Kitasatospora nipponensis]|uniref:Uncharacterized protein n=1 Tax=Kitasatospora nipponensis TaxID=258049 RepID=A0ABP4GAT7_9ACTN